MLVELMCGVGRFPTSPGRLTTSVNLPFESVDKAGRLTTFYPLNLWTNPLNPWTRCLQPQGAHTACESGVSCAVAVLSCVAAVLCFEVHCVSFPTSPGRLTTSTLQEYAWHFAFRPRASVGPASGGAMSGSKK